MGWLLILTTAGILLISSSKIANSQESQTLTTAPLETRAAAYPNRIEITVKISAHEDLKIAQDMTIAKGQIIRDRILRLLLDYEAAERRHELLSNQLQTLEQQQRVARVSYRNGRGSTSQMLSMGDKRDRLVENLTNASIIKDEAVRGLLHLI